MTTPSCPHCGQLIPSDRIDYCSESCRARSTATVAADASTDWLRARLAQDAIRRTWSVREEHARRLGYGGSLVDLTRSSIGRPQVIRVFGCDREKELQE